jgi:hypothetical protein
MDCFEQPREWKMDMRFGMWNVGSIYRVDSLKTVASKVAKYNLDLMAVQGVKWDSGGSEPADDYICCMQAEILVIT